MFSERHQQLVEQIRQYHLDNKTSTGSNLKKYHFQIQHLVQRYQAKTMWDYGCGKGYQYTQALPWGRQNRYLTFDQYLGLDSYYAYDPCVEGLDQMPPSDQHFDALICVQVLGNIPDEDFENLINLWQPRVHKFVFIGMLMDHKSDPSRSLEWYLERFSSWRGADLYWYFKSQDHPINSWWNINMIPNP
jgi:hypothetical protein